METSRQRLLSIVEASTSGATPVAGPPLDATELGSFYIHALYLQSVVCALIEQHWILTHDLPAEEVAFQDFMNAIWERELRPLAYLMPRFGAGQCMTLAMLKKISKELRSLPEETRKRVASYSDSDYARFVESSVHSMRNFCDFEEDLQSARHSAEVKLDARLSANLRSHVWPASRATPSEGLLPAVSYRSFDHMDEIFRLDFKSDLQMAGAPANSERLYENGGAGVQTSYACLLAALRYLHLPQGAHLIDLGSGFGRMGFMTGLFPDDLRFSGYEYVAHRVEISNSTAQRAGLNSRVKFYEQDLGDPAFEIPLADVYYMYDPFSPETYAALLDQLNSISKKHQIAVLTKADAGTWFRKTLAGGSWAEPETLDQGYLFLFRSRPKF